MAYLVNYIKDLIITCTLFTLWSFMGRVHSILVMQRNLHSQLLLRIMVFAHTHKSKRDEIQDKRGWKNDSVRRVNHEWNWKCWQCTLSFFKVGLEEIEKLENDTKQCEKLTLETWNWKVMKNIWSVEHFLFSKRLDFQAKSQSWKRRTKR